MPRSWVTGLARSVRGGGQRSARPTFVGAPQIGRLQWRAHWGTVRALLAAAGLWQMTIFLHAASAARWQSLDMDWRFHLGEVAEASRADFADAGWRVLNVPHDFSVEGDFSTNNFSCTGYLPGGIAWYRKSFFVPVAWGEKMVSVQFDGVSEKSQVWLNGGPVEDGPGLIRPLPEI